MGEVRIIGGQWKRSKLPVPDAPGLRPTSDRIRETLFNWLGQTLTGWRVLDAFAGSGALGFEADLVGRSHECDFPPSVKRLPVCTSPKFALDGTSYEIDQRVKALVQEGLSVYRVDGELLQALEPEVIVTQTQCEVCAVSLRDVERATCAWLRACQSRPAFRRMWTGREAEPVRP